VKLYLNKTPEIIRPFAKDMIWSLPSETPSLFLTFDDGPIPEITPRVCTILAQFNAKATFFCVGDNVKKHPVEYQQLLEEGHSVGNHTYNHLNGWSSKNLSYYRNVYLAKKYINSRLFRPPYGKMNRRQSMRLKDKFDIIMWDVLSGDFDSNVSASQCADNVIKNARNGSIIVFHDSLKASKTMLKALPEVLSHFARLNYQFKAIPMNGLAS
jgi:peptidoglycan/xylan/chitin deacetylase (PgdA/CDA1 family)